VLFAYYLIFALPSWLGRCTYFLFTGSAFATELIAHYALRAVIGAWLLSYLIKTKH
jgi:hypothetical protein